MYRAVTYYFIKNNIQLRNPAEIDQALQRIDISFENIDGENHTFLNGEDIESEIRKMYVSNMVSPVAAISAVRRHLVRQQKAMGLEKGIVMDGRDIGTVVFPDAEVKLFLTASIATRAQRRYTEIVNKGLDVDKEEVLNNLSERDRIDSSRADSPLRQADDAVLIDNSNLSKEEQLEMIKALVMVKKKRSHSLIKK